MAPRLGQGTFRLAVTSAYSRACVVTGEHSLPALEAAHIRPYGDGGEHEVSNGLLLRSDIHRLFDTGYVGVTPDYKFVVSDRLRGDFSNGRSYCALSGRPIELPAAREEWPKGGGVGVAGGGRAEAVGGGAGLPGAPFPRRRLDRCRELERTESFMGYRSLTLVRRLNGLPHNN